MAISSKSCLGLFLYALIFLTVVFPSGSLLGFNYKIALIVFGFVFFLVGLGFVGAPVYLYQTLVGFVGFISFYFFVALVNGVLPGNSLSHAIAFLSLFCVIFLSIVLIHFDKKRALGLRMVVIYSAAVYSFVKLIVCLLIGVGFFSPEAVQLFLSSFFGFEFIGLDAGYFYRIHIPIDFLLPLVFLCGCSSSEGGLSAFKKAVIGLLVFLAILISYSRLLYFIFFVAAFFVAFDYIRKAEAVQKVMMILLGVVLFFVFLYLASDFLVERYSGEMASASDGPRVQMYDALVEVVSAYPFLGKGLGSGSEGLVRFVDMPWYYELQWLSFLAQFGIVGFLGLFSMALLPVFISLKRGVTYFSFSVLSLYVLWLGVGFFNGFMLTSSAGVIFLFFILLLFGFGSGVCAGVADKEKIIF